MPGLGGSPEGLRRIFEEVQLTREILLRALSLKAPYILNLLTALILLSRLYLLNWSAF